MENNTIKKIIVDENYLSKEDIINFDDNEVVCIILINIKLKENILLNCCQVLSKMIIIQENQNNESKKNYNKWIDDNKPIIFLEANDEDLILCINKYSNKDNKIWCQYTVDDKNSFDILFIPSLCFNPMQRKEIPHFIKKMKQINL